VWVEQKRTDVVAGVERLAFYISLYLKKSANRVKENRNANNGKYLSSGQNKNLFLKRFAQNIKKIFSFLGKRKKKATNRPNSQHVRPFGNTNK
jgi:hypothetical protein